MRLTIAIGFLAMLNGSAFCGEIYRDAKRQFQFKIPAGWVPLTPAELNSLNNLTAQSGQGSCFAGFRLDGQPFPDGPFFVVVETVQNTAGMTYEELERELQSILGKPILAHKSQLPETTRKLSMNEVALDRDRNRITMGAFDESTKTRGSFIGHIGAHRVIFLNSYLLESELGKHQPAIQSVNDSFQFDAGAEFQPVAGGTTAKGFLQGERWGRDFIWLLGVTLIVIWIWLKLRPSRPKGHNAVGL